MLKKLSDGEVLGQGHVGALVTLLTKINELVDTVNKMEDNKPVVPKQTRSKK